MLFNSYEFILVFLPVVLIIYFSLCYMNLFKVALGALVVASLSFYGYWDIRYLPLLIASILFNHSIGRFIVKKKSKRWLFIGVAVDLILLGYFKYYNFFVDNINVVFNASYSGLHIVLPLGISFFTFTQIAFLVDAYRRETEKYDFLSYALFVTIFPHLIAGPILYHKDMIPQFGDRQKFSFSHENFSRGCLLFIIGLSKKILIADMLIKWVKPVFDNPAAATLVTSWTAALAYTFQLYFDFSGYSDMAIGLGLMFNFVLPINFNSPYAAVSIIDFWRRWHITLSAFLKNYLYIPLGGNRGGHQIRNIFITMLLGGLWHGAGWTFIIWGGIHGTYLAINHWWSKRNWELPNLAAKVATFVSVVIAWVFFRAGSVEDALHILKAMFGCYDMTLRGGAPLLSLGLLFLIAAYGPNSQQLLSRFRPTKKLAVAMAVVLIVCLSRLNRVSEFLYFQF